MRARGIVKVLQSTSPQFNEGQFGYGPVGWSEYSVLDADAVRPITSLPSGLDMTHHIGTLGLTGMTAYYGLVDIVGARRGETVLVSGAAGATGSMAVRIARHLIKAERVIGIAGTDEKCRWVEKIVADKCRFPLPFTGPGLYFPLVAVLCLFPLSCSALVFPLSCRS
jgi:NADPH-dependent curcumin reductase CurA